MADDQSAPEPASEPKDQRIPIMMSASEVSAIDDWSFSHRVRSRASAIRILARRGMLLEKLMQSMGAVTLSLNVRGTNKEDRQKAFDAAQRQIEMFYKQIEYVSRIAEDAKDADPLLTAFVRSMRASKDATIEDFKDVDDFSKRDT